MQQLRRHPRVTASPLSLEVRALARLEGSPQSTTLNKSFEARRRRLAPQDDGSLRLEVFRDAFDNFTARLRDLATPSARVLQIIGPSKTRAQSDPKRDAGNAGGAVHPQPVCKR
jgi:hypothetical protein